MDLIKQCEERVWSGWNKYQCSKNAKVERNGKHYCTIHDPVRKKKIDDIKMEEYREELRQKEYDRKAIEYCRKKKLTIKQLEDAVSEKAE